jgi:hypothetical protein
LFAEGGAAVLVSPQKALNEDKCESISYQGKIGFGGKLTAGTHKTEATVNARYVIRATRVKTLLGTFNAEFSPVGVFGRGFVRYADGRETGLAGFEGGGRVNAMANIGRLGIGLAGEITVSTDPALKTDNPAGSTPLLWLPGLGGPAGHHGSGRVLLTWTF